MDKRGARIVFGCLAGTMVLVLLIFLATLLTRKSCELIIIEPSQLRSSSMAEWSREKPLLSHDKTTLFKISAYLEYNIQSSKDKSQTSNSGTDHTSAEQDSMQQPQQPFQQQQQQQQQPHSLQPNTSPNPAGQAQQQPQQLQSNQPVQVAAQASNQAPIGATGKGPTPSVPQSGITNQQLANSSQLFNSTVSGDSKSEKPRFLPLKLTDMEMKKIEDNRYTYTLKFNCTIMKLIVVRRPERVFVEKITVELKLESKDKSKCELQLPTAEVFATEVSPLDGWAHYHCDKPLKFNCYHRSSKHADLLLAELHINAIEFETTGIGGPASSNHSIHKDSKFLGARSTSARCP